MINTLVSFKVKVMCALTLASMPFPQGVFPANWRVGDAFAQELNNGVAPSVKFDVISIRPSKPRGEYGITGRCTSDGYVAVNMPLKLLIQAAYGLKDYQLSGEPSWADSEMYDVQAKVAENDVANFQKAGRNACQIPLQSLLAERFGLEIRHGTRLMPIFQLSIAKHGERLTKATLDESDREFIGIGQFSARAITMPMFIEILSRQIGHSVVDKTGLTGRFAIELHWNPDILPSSGPDMVAIGGQGESEASDPSIVDALKEQLGLELKQVKGTVQTVMVEQVRKPSGN